MKKEIIVMIVGMPILLFMILFFSILTTQSSGGSEEVVAVNVYKLDIPFKNKSQFVITSKFGYRFDPFGSGDRKFHSGIDLGSPSGTDIVASADGVVYQTGYQENGLGNYVYIKHEVDGSTIYTAYGHMLDDSIVVKKDAEVTKGQKIGEVGSTGASTGAHLHFMIMKKVPYTYNDLIDPFFVINGLS